MKPFPVYPLFDLSLVKGEGAHVFDDQENKYLDFYGGHAVISVGHHHPKYKATLENQLSQLAYYSNSVKLPIQEELADKLGTLSGYHAYDLFLCNSGAEANENALKLASFHTGRKKVIAFDGGFHGRTSAAVAVTDNPKIQAELNDTSFVIRLPYNNIEQLKQTFAEQSEEIAAVIVEPIQGVNGIQMMDEDFMQAIEQLCNENGSLFIADEVQAGFGRTGKFFSHQLFNVRPHLITMAKGMGNGFPVGGVLIHPSVQAWFGMLGTTFGGNPLACAAALSVVEIIKEEQLLQNAQTVGDYLIHELKKIPQVKNVRGVGLMVGIEFDFPVKVLRKHLIFEGKVLTGSSKQANILRLLPPLNITKKEVDIVIAALKQSLFVIEC